MKSRAQLSPHLEKCCLLLSANVSYASTAQDLESLTGLKISPSTQQRLVQRYEFTAVRVKQEVEELTVDRGKVRLRTPKGQGCEWRDYKAVNLDGQAVAAYFQDNQVSIAWVNQQQLSEIVTCIGDGRLGNLESHRWHCHSRQPPGNFRLVSSSRKPLQSRRRQGSFGKGKSFFVAGKCCRSYCRV